MHAPDANLYALTFIGGPAYDNSGDGTVSGADTTLVATIAGARATAPFVVDQHLVFATGSEVRCSAIRRTTTTAWGRWACGSCPGESSADAEFLPQVWREVRRKTDTVPPMPRAARSGSLRPGTCAEC